MLSTLWAAADQLPIDPTVPSLWPLLEHRIADCKMRKASPKPRRRIRLGHGHNGGLGTLNGERPLHRAWACDSLREVLNISRRTLSGRPNQAAIFGGLGTAAVFAFLIVHPVLQYQRNTAERVIQANRSPLADQPQVLISDDTSAPEVTDLANTDDATASALSEDDLTRVPELTRSGLESGTAVKNTPKTRLGYDLEHGIPAPPDAREAKPVY